MKVCAKGECPDIVGAPEHDFGSSNSLHPSLEQSDNFFISSSEQVACVKYLKYLTSQKFS